MDELGLKKPSSGGRIVTNRILRDESIERRIIEQNRERLMYVMMLAGGIMLVIALLW